MGDQLAPIPWTTRPVYGANWALSADAVNDCWKDKASMLYKNSYKSKEKKPTN